MNFAPTDDQRAIDQGIRRITVRFGDEYAPGLPRPYRWRT